MNNKSQLILHSNLPFGTNYRTSTNFRGVTSPFGINFLIKEAFFDSTKEKGASAPYFVLQLSLPHLIWHMAKTLALRKTSDYLFFFLTIASPTRHMPATIRTTVIIEPVFGKALNRPSL